MSSVTPPLRSDYPFFHEISTRWSDNDVYGHINNVTYYSYFDTAANVYLIEHGNLDIHQSPVVAYVVSSSCDYYKAMSYPGNIDVGLRVAKLGNSSVRYQLATFEHGQTQASASGEFVHVFVERASGQSTPIPSEIRSALETLL